MSLVERINERAAERTEAIIAVATASTPPSELEEMKRAPEWRLFLGFSQLSALVDLLTEECGKLETRIAELEAKR